MKNITIEQLNEILENHRKWLNDEGGMRADLRLTNLSHANLEKANLSGADLYRTDLSNANLKGANLRGSNLRGSDLSNATLMGADLGCSDLKGSDLSYSCLFRANLLEVELEGANLSKANLEGTNLEGAYLRYSYLKGATLRDTNLRWADLEGANLSYSDLKGANLRGANLKGTDLRYIRYDETTYFFSLQCPEEGSFIGYKKADDKIIKLLITEDSLRSSATSRKCRCSKAKVLSITNFENTEEFEMVKSDYDKDFIYEVGKTIEVKDFDEDRWNECSTGIHFFITRQEAIEY